MKSVNIPKFFHEIFGYKSTVLELVLICLFSVLTIALLLSATYTEWSSLVLYKKLVVLLLALDISGGVIANLTLSTNNYYAKSPKARRIFIAIHVQPLILSLVLWNYFWPCFLVWCYTIASSIIVSSMIEHPLQRPVGGFLAMLGLLLLLLFFLSLPKFVLIILLLYLIKVTFSFSVNHYAARED